MATTQTLTVLFTDMVDSTALASSIEPGEADVLRQEHFSVLRQALAANAGTEVKSLGDGIMAVFSSTATAIACAGDQRAPGSAVLDRAQPARVDTVPS